MTTDSSGALPAGAAAHLGSTDVPNCRSKSYLVARAILRCPRCATIAPVVGLMLPAGHETLVDTEDREAQHWETAPCSALLFFIEQFPERVRIRLQRLAPHYRPDLEAGSAQSYWMNHCASCGFQHCDTELYCELDGAFAPLCAQQGADLEQICLFPVPERCEARVSGYTYATCRDHERLLNCGAADV